jgi:Fe-coproporphyrin III synthase
MKQCLKAAMPPTGVAGGRTRPPISLAVQDREMSERSVFPLAKHGGGGLGVRLIMTTDAKPKHRFWRGKILPKLALTVVPFPKNTFCSIDVTSKCNLRCQHCYYFSYTQDRSPELSVEEWLSRIERMQSGKGAFFSCTWVGGEPLLRRELIEQGRRFFRANRVVTNGTLPIPHWRNVEFHISVDGTESIHDAIRGSGCYAKIKANLDACRDAELKIAIACCLNRANVGCVEELVREWREIPQVNHVLFDFFTPIQGVKEDLWLSFEKRDRAIDQLEALRERYGSFIGGPPRTHDLMRTANRHTSVGKKCVFVQNGTAFDAWGNVKKPCVIGPQADCDRCGCIVPFSVRAWKLPSNLFREMWRDLKTRNS